MTFTAAALITLLAGYLVGSIPFGVLIGRARGIDVRAGGSGNIGATNVARLLGPKWGVLVFVLDLLKGILPMLAAHGGLRAAAGTTQGESTLNLLWLATGVCTILGHNFSLFLKFRGGKGVSTSLGVALGAFPHLTYPALIAVAVWGLMLAVCRIVSLASVVAGVLFPCVWVLLTWARGDTWRHAWPFGACAGLVALLLLVRHRANLNRILMHTEPRIGPTLPESPKQPSED